LVLYFDCHANVLERRLLRRAQSSGRADDNAETIKKRLDVFYQTSFPVIQHYVKNQRCYSVSGEGTEEEVYQETQRAFSRRPLYHSNIVFVLGAPLSGKGTQCSKLADDFGLVHLSTGDLLREEVAGKTDIGLEVEGMMKEGKLVPSEYLVEMLRDRVARNMKAPGFLIDGYPLTMDQIGEFEAKIGPCRAVLAFKCPVQVLEERLVERSKTSGREDDNLDTMRKRITTFETQSLPVIDYFKKQGKCLEVSSEQTVEQVYEESKSLFKKPIRIDHPNVIFVLGNVGSGKGTQCSYIVQEFGFKHISTGDLLRNEVKQQTPIGRMVEQYMNQGQMAPSV
jgi:adenylate kinase